MGRSRVDSLRHAPRPLVGLVLAVTLFGVPGGARAGAAGPLDLEPEGVRPGLLAAYRSLVDREAAFHRVEPKPAFHLGHASPHPRLPAGPFEVAWSGVLLVQEASPIAFHAVVGGALTVEVDGVTVLEGRGLSDEDRLGPKQVLERAPGHYRLAIRYRALDGVPARLQLFWEAPAFAREPLPAWRLGHLTEDLPPEAVADELAARGRDAIGRLGCARCHAKAFPGVDDPPLGPSLADAGGRLDRAWILHWLEDPAKVRPDARMPVLFATDRRGFVERWIVADFLARPGARPSKDQPISGDHRKGRIAFHGLGCVACHLLPDRARAEQPGLDRVALEGLGDRLGADDLAAFLGNPRSRFPDGRMPRFPLTPEVRRDLAAFLLLWSKPLPAPPDVAAPTPAELQEAVRRLEARSQADAATTLLRDKGCSACHAGLGTSVARDVPLPASGTMGCLSDDSVPRYRLEAATRKALAAYLKVAGREHPPSGVVSRGRRLERAGCVRCHQRDGDRPPPLEVAASTLGSGHLEALPFQRTPRLTNPHQKYTRAHLLAAVRDGVSGLRPAAYSYRMPAFGTDAEALVAALAEQDGAPVDGDDPPPRASDDPTLATLAGPDLVGSRGYSCIACHVWNGEQLSLPDPGAVGPDLARVPGRIRRDWFDRFLEAPARSCPGTPMPAIFPRGQPALLKTVLGGDPAKQRDALWSYFALGKHAPAPKPPPPFPIAAPKPGTPPLVAQVPIRLPDGTVVESLSLLYAGDDLVIYDLAAGNPRAVFTGARILRNVQARTRQFLASGTHSAPGLVAELSLRRGEEKPETVADRELQGYDRLHDGVRIRWRLRFASGVVPVEESLRVVAEGAGRRLARELRATDVPAGMSLELHSRSPQGVASASTSARRQSVTATTILDLPPARPAPPWEETVTADLGTIAGSQERPGYRAIAYPRPKTVSGEDRVMPVALAVDPQDGRVFVASLKTGELFVLRDPNGDGSSARFDDYGHGLFQDALSMRAEADGLYVLHRRNLTRVRDTDGDGVADRFDRVAALPHGVADTYDYGYGLVRDRHGDFLVSYAPYSNTHLPGSGGVVRLVPGEKPREVAFGFRNPIGWCNGPDGEVFFTDNQGEWVAANKLCHLEEGRYHGFPNAAQRQHASKPAAKPTVWVPYSWARSLNGVTYDNTGGKFGPFAGQFFLAELMFGGAVIRADVERVNGVYQGACFPFWGKGLMGPVSLAFDPKGRLFVGGITEPGWMAQPDRGALFRIDFTGATPFEMQTIRVLPRGFRIVFTTPVDRHSASDPASYRLEHYRYEYTGAYGSPELDRTTVAVERVEVSDDGRSVALTTAPLVKDRVYMVTAAGVRSSRGEALVHPSGAYTLNEVPAER